MQKFVEIEGQKFLVFERNGNVVISDNECIHSVYTTKDLEDVASFDVPVTIERKEGDKTFISFGYVSIDVEDILKMNEASPESISDFIRYFGIKPRIHSNYQELKRSLFQIGFTLDEINLFPSWERRKQ